MNKTAQYQGPLNENMFGRAHPVLILGIMVYVCSFFVPEWKKILNWAGIALIMLGSVASIYNITTGAD